MKWFKNKKESEELIRKDNHPPFDYEEGYHAALLLSRRLQEENNAISKELVWWKEKALNFKKFHQ